MYAVDPEWNIGPRESVSLRLPAFQFPGVFGPFWFGPAAAHGGCSRQTSTLIFWCRSVKMTPNLAMWVRAAMWNQEEDAARAFSIFSRSFAYVAGYTSDILLVDGPRYSLKS